MRINSPVVRSKPRIISLDIERAPMLVEAWGLWDQNIPIQHIVRDSRMISFAVVSLDDKKLKVFRSEYHNGRTKMLADLWRQLDKADVVVSYNGVKFDEKHISTEFVKDRLPPPSKFKSVDLLPFVRRKFNFDSNKLDYVSQAMRVGKKLDYSVSHSELLKGCERGDAKSMKLLEEYNVQDALLNLRLYGEFKEAGWL